MLKIQSQTLRDFQSAFQGVLDIAVFGILGPPSSMSLKAPVWYLSIGSSCGTSCPQAMKTKLSSRKTQVCELLIEEIPQAAITYLPRSFKGLASLGPLYWSEKELLITPFHACS